MEWIVLAAANGSDSLPTTGAAEVIGLLGFGLVAQFLVFRQGRDRDRD